MVKIMGFIFHSAAQGRCATPSWVKGEQFFLAASEHLS